NNDIQLLMKLLKDDIVEEKTILTQNITKKTKRAVRVIEGYHPDEVLAKLEKVIKQYDLYAYLSEEQHKTIFLTDIEDMGFSKSSLDGLIKKGYVEKYDAVVERDPFKDRVFEQESKQQLTEDQYKA
ncbi:primosomal protein N', partial [Staphylococcus aureus]|nr:primosomal protein N' [Staphylococcus aureus]